VRTDFVRLHAERNLREVRTTIGRAFRDYYEPLDRSIPAHLQELLDALAETKKRGPPLSPPGRRRARRVQ